MTRTGPNQPPGLSTDATAICKTAMATIHHHWARRFRMNNTTHETYASKCAPERIRASMSPVAISAKAKPNPATPHMPAPKSFNANFDVRSCRKYAKITITGDAQLGDNVPSATASVVHATNIKL